MSGVEAAGFVLAVLPLLISALEDYRRGSEPLKDWWRFRTVYKECYQNISIQKIFFEENLEQLLTPLVEDEDHLAALLEKPGGDGWKDPDLEEMLKKKMPKSYDLYLGVIEEMNDVVEKLGNGLGITKVRQQQILQEEEEPAQQPSTRNKYGYFGGLKNRLGINKISSRSKVVLEEVETKEVDEPAAQPRSQFKWEYEFQRIKFSIWDRQERNKLIEKLAQNNEKLQRLLDSSDRLASSRRLRESKKSLVGATFLRGVWLHANSLFTSLTKAWRCDCQPFHEANLLLRHRTTSNVDFKVLLFFDPRKACPDPGPWTWQETDIKMLDNKPRPTITARTVSEKAALPSPKPKDGLRPVVSNEAGRSSTSVASTTSTTPSAKSSKAKRGVAWAVPDPQPASAPPQSPPKEDVNVNEITNLCTTIACSSHSLSCLGFLNHEDHRYCVYPVMKQQASWDTRETVTLESLLMRPAPDQPSTPCIVLSRQERYFIALTLASSLLQLHATPWLPTQWSKKDILFMRNGPDSIFVDQPYISPQPSSQSPTYHDTSKSISALGIMLLELCFGIALEDHEIRRGFLGADGQPNPALDLVAAKEWCERYAEGEAGQDFADAIGWCLRNKTGRKSTDVKDEGWKDALFTEVVKPLQHCHDLMTMKYATMK